MKLAIIGSRTFNNFDLVEQTITNNFVISSITKIISGGAKGADTLAEQWAAAHDKELQVFNAKWGEYGKSAGFKRNIEIVEAADQVLCFWDGVSAGTASSIELCKKHNKPCTVIYITKE